MPEGHTAQATFTSSIYGQSAVVGDMATFCGDAGTLIFNSDWGAASLDLKLYRKSTTAWEDLRVPDAVLAAQPQVDDTIQRYWTQFSASL